MCLKLARLLVLTKVPSFDQKDQPQSVTQYLLLQLGAPGKNYTFLTEDKDLFILHDVIKWERFPRYWPFVRGIHRSPVNSPHKDQWRRDLMFSLICAWIGSWVNNREAGDLRRHRTHYDSHCNIHSQYHSCWWSGDVRSQSISSYDTDLPVVLLEYILFQHQDSWPLTFHSCHESTVFVAISHGKRVITNNRQETVVMETTDLAQAQRRNK